jgi:Ca2+-binding RTX toxin-like protein
VALVPTASKTGELEALSAEGGLITEFSPLSSHRIKIDGVEYGVQNGNYAWSIANPDSQTLRFEVRSGDQWRYDDNRKERSEVSSDTIIPAGETIEVSYRFMIEPGEANQATGAIGTGNWLTLGQFHSEDGESSSVFAVEMIGEKMAIRAAYKLPGQDYVAWYAFKDSQDIVRGKYYEMDIRVNFANDQTGFLEVWRDGVQIVDYDGPMGYGADVYWKYGIYRHEQDETIAVNYADMWVRSGDKGVMIVGTKVTDQVDSSQAPPGQPTPTSRDDLILTKGRGDTVSAGGGDDVMIAGGGADRLKGGRGDDLLIGGKGSDTLNGGDGSDVFQFAGSFGHDTIVGLKPGKDVIQFDDAIFRNFKAVSAAMEKHRGGTLIDAGDSSVFLKKVSPNHLDADDFLFV